MKTLIDVNVAFPILVAWHAHHPSAWPWWERQLDASVALCWPVRLAVLRLLTNAKVMNGRPIPTDEALSAWASLAEDPRTVWIGEVPGNHEGFFRQHVAGREPSPNLWTDAWLAALAMVLEQRLTTFDAGFRHFSPGRLDLELLS